MQVNTGVTQQPLNQVERTPSSVATEQQEQQQLSTASGSDETVKLSPEAYQRLADDQKSSELQNGGGVRPPESNETQTGGTGIEPPVKSDAATPMTGGTGIEPPI